MKKKDKRSIANKKLTNKQKAFIEARIANPTDSLAESARKAGYAPATVQNVSKNIIDNRGTQRFIEKLATDDTLAVKINEGLEAYKRDITGDYYPDFRTRLEYLREILGLKGYKKEAVVNIDNKMQVNQLIFEVDEE